jgi:DNA-binding transcriptional LysR family regulator
MATGWPIDAIRSNDGFASKLYASRMDDVRRLRTLVEVAKRGSFSAAADALAFTQPSISRQIAALEAEVGVRLLERDARRVRLTQAGALLVEHAEAVLLRLDAAQAQLDALAGLEGGRLRVSAFASAHTWLVPAALARFTARHPKVELSVAQGTPHDEFARLRSGDVDLALVTSWDVGAAGAGDGIGTAKLLEDELYLALPRSHPLAGRERLAMADLANETWIEGAHPDCLGSLEDLARMIGAPPRIGFRCDDWIGKQALVGAGLGITLYPRLALGDPRPDIAVRPLPRSLPSRDIYAAYPSDHQAPAVRAMLACLREAAASPDAASERGRTPGPRR